MSRDFEPFRNRHKFQDDVWHQIKLNDLERDVIDTPEFQRLFRTSQLGFVDLVYQTANHTRGAHSIGACHITNVLIDKLNENTREAHESADPTKPNIYAAFSISEPERVLIRLGALLHDISHMPFSHDVEKKTHMVIYSEKEPPLKLRSCYGHYDKHDDYDRNPLLYILLCDPSQSVLARVLERYSAPFYNLILKLGEPQRENGAESEHEHLSNFIELLRSTPTNEDWNPMRTLLPQLLFHLLVYENARDAKQVPRSIVTSFPPFATLDWHLGPRSLSPDDARKWHDAWYQPFRHDIIGNTLSADLIDYLTRDPRRLAINRRIDLQLLSSYVLVNYSSENESQECVRCAIDLYDHKRGTTRIALLNDIFRLLDLRHEIHEKAVMHRVVQAAIAMLARALLLLKKAGGDRWPKQVDLLALGKPHHAVQSEDVFLRHLLGKCRTEEGNAAEPCLFEARRLIEKIIERRVYRPLMLIPGDRALAHFQFPTRWGPKPEEFRLRTLAAIIDSEYYSRFLLFVCLCVEKYLEGVFDRLDDLLEDIKKNVIAPEELRVDLLDALEIPSRVIIWTLPFKQLYKNPALVVALDSLIGQIDTLRGDASFSLPNETKRRIETAIDDADSKYTSLWRLYVFVSDGLYYSGILTKVLEKIGVSRPESHSQRLENGQALLAVAIEVVCNRWNSISDSLRTVAEKQARLERPMDVATFKGLIQKWVTDFQTEDATSRIGRARRLSTVDISNYVHRFTLNRPISDADSRRCRDTRYKFDLGAAGAWNSATDPLSAAFRLVEFLKECGIDDPDVLSDRELSELIELYDQPGMIERCRAALQTGSQEEALKELWRWKPLGASVVTYPTDAGEIRRWLSREGEHLKEKRLVSREFTRATHQITQFVLSRDRELWPRIFEDLQNRIRNEAELFWNNIKNHEIIDVLERKWPAEKQP